MKRISALLIAMVLLVAFSVPAFAAPSKATQNLITVSGAATATPSAATVKAANDQLAKINSFVKSGNAAVSFFSATVQKEIARILPNVSTKNLAVTEFAAFKISTSQSATKGVTTTFNFIKKYTPGQVVVAVVGFVNANGSVTWIATTAKVAANGSVNVYFTPAMISRAKTQSTMIAILS